MWTTGAQREGFWPSPSLPLLFVPWINAVIDFKSHWPAFGLFLKRSSPNLRRGTERSACHPSRAKTQPQTHPQPKPCRRAAIPTRVKHKGLFLQHIVRNNDIITTRECGHPTTAPTFSQSTSREKGWKRSDQDLIW